MINFVIRGNIVCPHKNVKISTWMVLQEGDARFEDNHNWKKIPNAK
jgi:hypothetical protein